MRENEIAQVVIPATAEVSSEARKEQSARAMEREGLRAAFPGRAGKVFKRGVKLDPEKCMMTTPLDDWSPMEGRGGLKNVIPPADLKRLDKMFSLEGLAATIALTDTAAGVRETIEYDENEVIVKPVIEKEKGAWDYSEEQKRLAGLWNPDFKLEKVEPMIEAHTKVPPNPTNEDWDRAATNLTNQLIEQLKPLEPKDE